MGRWLLYLKEKGYTNLIGLDFVEELLFKIRAYDKEIILYAGSVDNIPMDRESVDFYLSGGVIEHFEEGTDKALAEASRILTKQGIFFLSVPYQNFYRSTLRRFITMPLLKLLFPRYRNKNRVFYQYYYSKRNLRKMLHNADFEILESFYLDQFHTKNKRIGIYLEFPFLRRSNGTFGEVGGMGMLIAKTGEIFSRGVFCSSIVFVCKKLQR